MVPVRSIFLSGTGLVRKSLMLWRVGGSDLPNFCLRALKKFVIYRARQRRLELEEPLLLHEEIRALPHAFSSNRL